MKRRLCILFTLWVGVFAFLPSRSFAQNKQPPKKEVIPHAQDRPPGPALSPQEALKKMQVPPGFRVELVAAEPDIVNPVSMTFDERGRIWITESIEYPRRSAGPGKDRVKLLESTKGDGKFDKITTVIEGLNIPSGIAIGHGGVWVANAPDILYYPFEDFAPAKLGKPEVIVSGFGRTDTHELPNSLTWGPDGWLYGLNGVFNYSHIKHKGKDYKFTCALFRIHPKTKEFEIFCEGTSNPWGLAFNDNGDAFVSACVIDHLWHLTETGYYHRQGGAYPPYTWKIGSIVKHRHQKAAYCGLCWFDSDAYPPEYREKLYMGNIHGGCINCDELTRDGSTYFAKPRPDFLTANDAWFMPVAQKVGPDGCMYILDWYDRYHCYQDANRDPAGIDRLQGRLYRVVYKDYQAGDHSDLSRATDGKLIEQLGNSNVHIREVAQRLLTERLFVAKDDTLFDAVEAKLLAENTSPKQRHHVLWTMISSQRMYVQTIERMLTHQDPKQRAAVVRYLHGNNLFGIDREKFLGRAADASLDVQLQVAIAARKISGVDSLLVLLDVLTHCGDDKLIPHIVWQNLHPLLEKDGDRFLNLASKADLAKSPGLARLLPQAIDRILDNSRGDPAAVVGFIDKLTTKNPNDSTAKLCLAALTVKVQNNEITGPALDTLKKSLGALLDKFLDDKERHPLRVEASLLSVTLGEARGAKLVRFMLTESSSESDRLRALESLMTVRDASLRGCPEIGLVSIIILVRGYVGNLNKETVHEPIWTQTLFV